ncbi:polysaccharide deacetylase family protein [Haliangium ochraceum]|uniref:Polysaccharide deacetylase n=1 Tax=Haliangium ochraceum (strain DSM 14365 / JCM 11303 / SMP-2) TaxID=502025 RepID=D0LKC3_HALO1|nr:polysaccharide deacetylase family protein [Haliangium ochraceum]ACY13157.1 polysaccharide deacetylase [Haliangium ochraceum DSM 14365]
MVRASRPLPFSSPQCAVSIDVDGLDCYYRIHALGEPPAHLRDVILRRALPRFAEIFARRGIHATFFLVGRDLDPAAPGADTPGNDVAGARAIAADLARAGHELASHSYSHRYEMARLSSAEAGAEIELAHALIGELASAAPVGFRAPGYDISPAMLGHLVRLGYSYDSSIFPAPVYYAAKAVVMAALAAAGKRTGAVLTNPRALLAPSEPYRPSLTAPWRRGRADIVELPVAVTPRIRAPVIGTSLLVAPDWMRARMLAAVRGCALFNFELHGIDLIDARDDDIPAELVARQPDLRVPLIHKRERFERILSYLETHFELRPLRDLAIPMSE